MATIMVERKVCDRCENPTGQTDRLCLACGDDICPNHTADIRIGDLRPDFCFKCAKRGLALVTEEQRD